MELVKKHEYVGTFAQFYFWRTYDQKEIDLVIEAGGALAAYEIKWQSQRIKTPNQWLETYKTPVNLISRDQFLNILLEPTPSAE